jgi:hypothetical protein
MSNEPVDLIPVPSGLSAYLLLTPLRGQEECRKQAGIGHWGRSRRNIGLRHMAHDTQAPRFSPQSFARDPRGFKLLMPALRTRRAWEPLHADRESTILPGTDGMVSATGAPFATADSQKPTAR